MPHSSEKDVNKPNVLYYLFDQSKCIILVALVERKTESGEERRQMEHITKTQDSRCVKKNDDDDALCFCEAS